MSRTTLIIGNDLRRRLRSPMATILFLVIPLAMTGLIGMIFDPGQDNRTKLPPIHLLVVDNDKDIAAKFLLGAFDQKELKEMFQVTLVDAPAGEKLMQKGKASAMLVIPEHFSADLADQKPSRLEVVKNPSEEFLPGVAEEFAATMAVGFSALAQVFADELRIIRGFRSLTLESVTIAEMTPFLEMARAKIIALKTYLSPMLLKVKSVTTKKPGQEGKPLGFNIFSYIFPGMLIMFLLFIIEPSLREIQNERADGKTRRMMFSPLSSLELVTARIFSGWLIGFLVCLLAMAAGMLLFGIDWGRPLLQLALFAIACFWCSAFFAMLNAFFRNKNQAGAFASPIILVFSAFGGSMLPLEQLPAGMRWVGKLTVNNWFITGCRRIMDGASPLLPLTLLAVTGLAFAAVAMIALPRRLSV
ncbi:MAG: ABC transporter permease [Candidatus Aminicenantes bacterium]|nr:ABC transporter permease [Candidatus Aminicenantes bacterium]